MKVFKGKSSLSQVDGSEEKVYKKYTNANLAFTKKMTIKSGSLVGHLNTILVRRGQNFE